MNAYKVRWVLKDKTRVHTTVVASSREEARREGIKLAQEYGERLAQPVKVTVTKRPNYFVGGMSA